MSRILANRVNCLDPRVIQWQGYDRGLESLSVYMSGTSETAQTPDRDDLGRLTMKKVGMETEDTTGDTIVDNVQVSAMQALTEYLNGSIQDDFNEAAASESGYDILFNIMPLLKPGIANCIFMARPDYMLFEQPVLSSTVFASWIAVIYQELMRDSDAIYTPVYNQFPYQVTEIGDVALGKNLAYLLLKLPSGGAEPGRIEVKEGNRVMARFEHWDDLMRDTERRAQQETRATWGIIDISRRGLDRPSISNRPSLEINGTTGVTLQCVRINIDWTPESQKRMEAVKVRAIGELAERVKITGGGFATIEAVSKPETRAAIAVETQAEINAGTKRAVEQIMTPAQLAVSTGLTGPFGKR